MIKKSISRTLTSMVLTLIIIIVISIIFNSMNTGLRLPYLDDLFDFARSRTGLIIFLGLPGIYFIIIQMWKMVRLLTQADHLK